MTRDNEVAPDGLFGSAFHDRALGELLLSAVFLGLWAVLSMGVIVQVILPLSTIVEASPTVAGAHNPDHEVALAHLPRADSAQGGSGSLRWILTGARARVDGRRLFAGDAPPARLEDDSLDPQSGCVPCQLCPLSDVLDEPTPALRERTEARP